MSITWPMAEAVRAAYRAGEDDETLQPIVLTNAPGEPLGRIQDGDYVIFYNLRGEREVELSQSLTETDFDKFERGAAPRVRFVTMIQYDQTLKARVAFPPIAEMRDTLCEVISANGLRLAKVAESEKSIHLTFFINGKRKAPFPGEDHLIVPSPHVPDFSQVPELNAAGVARETIGAMAGGQYDLVVTNLANVDVIGHIENPAAIKRAVNTVDTQIGRILQAAGERDYTVLITADHGTVEKWYYPDGAIDTGHTDSPVPCILVEPQPGSLDMRAGGDLTDIAPTVLQLLRLPPPAAMTGSSLLVGDVDERSRVLLLIVDGWGARDEREGNLIAEADTPVMDALLATRPHTRLLAAGEPVGMPPGTVGNSEVGHLHIGAGRRIYSDRVRINRAIQDGAFFENEAFLWAMRGAKRDGTRLHLLGIISFYSSHGSVEHLKALMDMARREGVPQVHVHGMLGRRGERPESGAIYVADIEKHAAHLGLGQVASIIGRYWSLDREGNWDRIEKTYRWLVQGQGRAVRLSE